MSDRYWILTSAEVDEIIASDVNSHAFISVALEAREYRRRFGPLGCEWLESFQNSYSFSPDIWNKLRNIEETSKSYLAALDAWDTASFDSDDAKRATAAGILGDALAAFRKAVT